jgi:hypothetical protein
MSRPHAETLWLPNGGHHGTQLRAKLGVNMQTGPKPVCGSHDKTLGGVANLDLPTVIGSAVPIVEPGFSTPTTTIAR